MIFKFEPIYKERVWGGTKIRDLFGRETPEGSLIGESWEIVDRKDDNSVLANTSHRGLTLAALLKSDGKSVMGPNWEPGRPFPLLVKWLDCSKRLSLQVHPRQNCEKIIWRAEDGKLVCRGSILRRRTIHRAQKRNFPG